MVGKNVIIAWMRIHKESYRDEITGELNYTLLAESCADTFDIYEEDCKIPELLFEIAATFQ